MEKRNLTLGILRIFVILSFNLYLIGIVSAHMGEDHSGGMMYGTYGYGGMLFGWIFSILVIVALILLTVWLMKQIQSPPRRRKR